MAKRLSNQNQQTTRKPVLFRLVTGKNGRTIYIGTIENKGVYKGRPLVLITGEEWDNDIKAMVKREIRAFIDPDMENVKLNIGEKVVVSYAPAKNLKAPGVIEEIAKLGQIITTITEHENKEYQKVIIYGKVKNVKWNEKHNVFSVAFMDLVDVEGQDYGVESRFISNTDNEEYLTFWTNVSFFGTSGQDTYQNRYPADRAEKDIHAGDTVVIMTQYRASVDRNTGKTYINHNANKYMVIESASAENSEPTENASSEQQEQNKTQSINSPNSPTTDRDRGEFVIDPIPESQTMETHTISKSNNNNIVADDELPF